jgi:predicted aspartyl protease
MHTRRTIFLLAGMAMSAGVGCLSAQPVAAIQPGHQVALEVSAYQLVFVTVQVNGVATRALVDTGSSSALRLSTRLARQLQLPLAPHPTATVRGIDGRPNPVQRGTLATLALGTLDLREQPFEVAGDRIETISAQVGTAFDAVLGWGFLSRRNVVLDYQRRLLQFGDATQPPAGPNSAVAYKVVNGLPVVNALLGGRNVTMLIDSGAPMCNIDIAEAGAVAGNIVTRELQLGSMRQPVEFRVKDLTIMRRSLGASGTLGNNLFDRRVLRFDVGQQTLGID